MSRLILIAVLLSGPAAFAQSSSDGADQPQPASTSAPSAVSHASRTGSTAQPKSFGRIVLPPIGGVLGLLAGFIAATGLSVVSPALALYTSWILAGLGAGAGVALGMALTGGQGDKLWTFLSGGIVGAVMQGVLLALTFSGLTVSAGFAYFLWIPYLVLVAAAVAVPIIVHDRTESAAVGEPMQRVSAWMGTPAPQLVTLARF